MKLLLALLIFTFYACERCETCLVTATTVHNGHTVSEGTSIVELCGSDAKDSETVSSSVYQNQLVSIVTRQECP